MAKPPLWARSSTSSGVISNGDPWGSEEEFDGAVCWRCMAVFVSVSTVGVAVVGAVVVVAV